MKKICMGAILVGAVLFAGCIEPESSASTSEREMAVASEPAVVEPEPPSAWSPSMADLELCIMALEEIHDASVLGEQAAEAWDMEGAFFYGGYIQGVVEETRRQLSSGHPAKDIRVENLSRYDLADGRWWDVVYDFMDSCGEF